MYRKKRTVAMLLAGGQGSRLGVLTHERAKPAVTYGGKYRIIDFPLSNCVHSGIDAVGVLTQYQPLELNTYIGNGSPWDLDSLTGGAFVLPPYVKGKSGKWYSGTADAIYQNMFFIEQFDPEYLVVLSGDHIYKMNYDWLINQHRAKEADATIAVLPVPIEEASRFGIMITDKELRIKQFEEKPERPKSNLASMGVYAFSWPVLKKYLEADAADESSSNDFGKDIIPAMLKGKERLFAYEYSGYWKDVGTIRSLWEANMELLQDYPPLNLYDNPWRILSRNPNEPPHYVDAGAVITNSMISEGCHIYGTVINSILSSGVTVAKNAVVRDSIIMTESEIGEGSVVDMSIIDEEVRIGKGCRIGDYASAAHKIAVIGKKAVIGDGASVAASEQVGVSETVPAVAASTEGANKNGAKPAAAVAASKSSAKPKTAVSASKSSAKPAARSAAKKPAAKKANGRAAGTRGNSNGKEVR
ncbi:MAG: glucose-1-phosphate adenylyltransferase [Clostridiales Family XIII bacterium]|jgi:glucose-1-phosphate adenylyltransferase|nr:glucose-1-phosphate adenylyltransferase [Clostridiales Family XIII bacterium]